MDNKLHIKKSFLLSGKDLAITKSVTVKHPTVQEVLDIDKENNGFYSESMYYSWMNIYICDPYDYMVYLDDKKIDYESIDGYDLFILMYDDMVNEFEKLTSMLSKEDKETAFLNNRFDQSFKFFLNYDHLYFVKDEKGELVLTDGTKRVIDREIYNGISDFITQINGIQRGNRINPADDFAKQLLIEDERSSLKRLARKSPDETENNRLGNLLSAITWGGNGSVSPFNRNSLHMYDLVDGVQRTDKLLNYNQTMTGLYSGCVDKDKIDIQKISWQL